ncbi:hypothetical protein E2C01_088390 [Portunus trituberculatus]|uniref:Uncharacterized protein n=1 Tax=Portunus trituberculatus TaxID=210409 RepID=A0A5B7JGG5_PORTR|nr:hypothetical protein [Portunus trituberculatus]
MHVRMYVCAYELPTTPQYKHSSSQWRQTRRAETAKTPATHFIAPLTAHLSLQTPEHSTARKQQYILGHAVIRPS